MLIFNFQFSIFNLLLYLCTVIWSIMGFVRKNRILNFEFLILNSVLLLGISCTKVSTPRPYGYYRITVPDTAYVPLDSLFLSPFNFQFSQNAVVQPRTDVTEPYWINIYYPSLDATIHCSYKPVRNNLRELTNDALEFVYRNASFANSIPEREYSHPEASVYGVLFDLEGNTASPVQFFLTDSTHHFFRAALYYSCIPNSDSLAPVNEIMRRDIHHMIESFRWQ